MINTYKFYKDLTARWYFDLPDYEDLGLTLDDLEMVCGADTMLDVIAGTTAANNTIYLEISDTQVLVNTLELINVEPDGGAWYHLKEYNGNPIDLKMWLCNVTLVLFPEFPNKIFFRKTVRP